MVLPDNRSHHSIEMLKRDAQDAGIFALMPSRLNDRDFKDTIRRLKPEIYLVDSYTRLIPDEILAITGHVGFNLHPGLLPQYRGAHVLNWTLVNGEPETGVTLHQLSVVFDEGPIVASSSVPVDVLDTVNDVDRKINAQIPSLLKQLEGMVKSGLISLRKQTGVAKHYRKRTPADGGVSIHKSAVEIYNSIRALTYPWPGAYIALNRTPVVIWQAMPVDLVAAHRNPGDIITKDGKCFLICGDNKLLFIEVINDPSAESYVPLHGNAVFEVFEKLCGISRNGVSIN